MIRIQLLRNVPNIERPQPRFKEKLEPYSNDMHKRLIPTSSKIPRIYGLPNIHKKNVPVRPIVSTTDLV